MDNPAQTPSIRITLLPNGSSGSKLNFTALLSPSLPTGDLPAALVNWPDTLQQWRMDGGNERKWKLTLQWGSGAGAMQVSAPCATKTPHADLKLWQALIDGKIPVRARTLNQPHTDSWKSSVKSGQLHDDHQDYRSAKALRDHILTNKPALNGAGRNYDPDSLADAANAAAAEVAPEDVYLSPTVTGEKQTAIPIKTMLADRNRVRDDKAAFKSKWNTLPQAGRINQRIKHALHVLEKREGEDLSAPALLAVYDHCVQSVGVDDASKAALKPALDAIAAEAQNCTMHTDIKVDAELFERIVHYVNFHLFHEVTQHVDTEHSQGQKKQDPLDFHQLLGLVHQYPVLLRPLGLALDFEGVDLSGQFPAGQSLATLQNLASFKAKIEPLQATGSIETHIGGAIELTALYTSCTIAKVFAACAADKTHSDRFLDIHDSSLFRVITEDSDGSAQKLIQQKRSTSRGREYETMASARLTVTDGRPPAGPGQALPSSRTKGISLYWEGRSDILANQIARNDDALGTIDKPLLLDDVTLGYRMDVRITPSDKDPNTKWQSLHLRHSVYEILDSQGEKTLYTWRPDTTDLANISATAPYTDATDEGFTTLGSSLAQTPEDTVMKTHECLVTWNGWPLSIPRKKLKFNQVRSLQQDAPKNLPRIRATFTQPAVIASPRLRFDQTYDLRFRHVDLAGNSLPPSWTEGEAQAQLGNPFERHEPLRAPQVLLEKPHTAATSPGEQGTVMVLRDDGIEDQSRVLVPPKEAFALVEFHGVCDKCDFPPAKWAFANVQLQSKGAFPSLAVASKNQWLRDGLSEDGSSQNDGIYLPSSSPVPPDNPYWPDPLVNYVRVESYQLDDTLANYVPAMMKNAPVPAYYRPFYPGAHWPQASPVRIVLRRSKSEISVAPTTLPLADTAGSDVPAILVELPPGATVLLQVTSAGVGGEVEPFSFAAVAPEGDPPSQLRYLVNPEEQQIGPPTPSMPALAGFSLFTNIQKLGAKLAARAAAMPSPAPGQQGEQHPVLEVHPNAPPNPVAQTPQGAHTNISGLAAAANRAAADLIAVAPTPHMQRSWRQQAATLNPPDTGAQDTAPVGGRMSKDHVGALAELSRSIPKAALIDGRMHQITPTRRITLVHAVSRPVNPPTFAKDGAGHSLFPVERQPGQSIAVMAEPLTAHWHSTGKITVHATWKDKVDDITQPKWKERTFSEVAGELVNDGLQTGNERRITSNNHAHLFRDTRAHIVTYSLSAYTRFREYFLPSETNKDSAKEIERFTKPGEEITVTVKSSVRPPVPAILYVIPVFSWKECTVDGKTLRGRTMALRVYLSRPFLVSGDRETVGVVFGDEAHMTTPASKKLISTWGGDPIVDSPTGIDDYVMTPADFTAQLMPREDDETTPTPWTPQEFSMAEGGMATVLPFNVKFHDERHLWYCDLPLSASKTASAFARLALVRWQRDSLADCFASQVALADFIQIRPDRWVSVSRKDHHCVKLAVTGVFPTETGIAVQPRLVCSVEQGWHGVSKDMQWRPITKDFVFNPDKPDGKGLSTYACELPLPGSMLVHKYRILIEELEWYRKTTDDAEKKFYSRRVYMHYVNL